MGATIEAADCELLARQERVIHFNGLLKKHCAELGVEYIDIFDEMTEGALPTTTCHLQPPYCLLYCLPYCLPTASLLPRDDRRRARPPLAAPTACLLPP